MHVHVGTMCTYVWRPEIDVRCLPQFLSTLFFSYKIFLRTRNWNSPVQLDWLTSSLRDPPVSTSQCWCYGYVPSLLTSHIASENWNLDFYVCLHFRVRAIPLSSKSATFKCCVGVLESPTLPVHRKRTGC